jgi:hypothetical protein
MFMKMVMKFQYHAALTAPVFLRGPMLWKSPASRDGAVEGLLRKLARVRVTGGACQPNRFPEEIPYGESSGLVHGAGPPVSLLGLPP